MAEAGVKDRTSKEDADAEMRESQIARIVLWLVQNPQLWIRRRVERHSLIDHRSMRRRVSLEFVLPTHIEGLAVADILNVIPVALLAKRPLRAFDLRTEDECLLPSLITPESTAVARSVILSAAKGLLQHDLLPRVTLDLEHIVGNDPPRIDAALKRMRGDDPTLIETVAIVEQRRKLIGEWDFLATMEDLASGFLLLTPCCVKPGERRVWEFTHDDMVVGRSPALRRPFVRLGLIPERLQLPTPAAAKAASFHCEVEAPSDMEIVRARLDRGARYAAPARTASRREQRELRRITETMNRGLEARDGGGIMRAHLHLPRPEQPVGERAAAIVEIRMKRNGFLRSAFLTCGIAAAMLTAGYHRLPALAKNVEPAVTLLLVVPGLLAVYLARPGEHALAASLLLGTRVMLLIAGLCAVIAGALLVAKLQMGHLHWWWLGLRDLSILATIPVGLACLLPRSGKGYSSAP